MSWKNEFSEIYEIPPKLAKLQKEFPKLEDNSWHNDAMPHLSISLGDDLDAEIWWDTEFQADSEFCGLDKELWRRFNMSVNNKSIRWTNDVNEIVEGFRLLMKVFSE